MSAQPDIEQLYEQQIKALPRAARLRLLARIADDLAEVAAEDEQPLDLLDLEGVGAEVWQGVDAKEYIDAERDSWERP
jgi:predicted GTPase